MILLCVTGILLFIFVSFWFTSWEMSVVTSSEIDVFNYFAKRRTFSSNLYVRVMKCFENPVAFFGFIALGNTIANELIGVLSGTLVEIAPLTKVEVFLVGGIVTLLSIMFGEIVPKYVSRARPEGFYHTLAVFGYPLMLLLKPLSGLLRTFVGSESETKGGDERYLGLLENCIREKTGFSLKNLSKELTAPLRGSVIKPWRNVVTLSETDSVLRALDVFVTNGYSRYPVLAPSGEVVGILHFKDLLIAVSGGETELTLRELIGDSESLGIARRGERLYKVLDKSRSHHLLFVVEGRPGNSKRPHIKQNHKIYNVVGIVTHGYLIKKLFMKEIDGKNRSVSEERVLSTVRQKPH